jgi:acylphosphatase
MVVRMRVSKLLRIHGQVQGVFYRESMRQEARRLGITGWVRNRKDGTVEALVQGEDGPVSEMINWCRQGPPMAAVSDIEIRTASEEVALKEFLRNDTE